MSFANRPWVERLAKMGDESEGEFQRWATIERIKVVRFGYDRPPFNVGKQHLWVKARPDFESEDAWYEVKGVGRDQLLKLRFDKLEALRFWQLMKPLGVIIWVWDSHNKRSTFVDLPTLENVLKDCEIEAFPEGHRYYAVPAERIFA